MNRFVTKMRNLKAGLQEKLAAKFLLRFPGKKSLNLKTIGLFVTPTILVSLIIYSLISRPSDSSFLARTTESLHKTSERYADTSHPGTHVNGVANESPQETKKSHSATPMNATKINYRAKQVIERADYADPSSTLPAGSNFIGRLITSIDTRAAHALTKIELPFGGSFQGNELLPPGSVVFAGVKYDGNGEKVFLDITSGAYPDGRDFKIRGQALSAKDFSPGIEGDYHSTFSDRVGGSLGLAFVSGLTDTLIEKEPLGAGGLMAPSSVAAKPTLKNGMLAGLSKVSDAEAQRMAKELTSKQPFVTVDTGKELIVSLLERYTNKK